MNTRTYTIALLLLASCKEGNGVPPPDPPEAAICGDGEVGLGEACDDGNQIDDDGCRNRCAIPFCGDGIVDANETCDDGNFDSTDSCNNACQTNTCGNGVADTGEVCFARQPALTTGVFPFVLVAADMNNDQLPDLLLSEAGQPGVAVFLATGPGTFANTPLRAATNESPFGVVAADLDGDGDLDAATANNVFDNAGNITASSTSIFLNDGNGQLTAQGQAIRTVGVLALSIAAGDLDSDGDQDLAMVGLNNGKLSILFNNNAAFTETEIPLTPQFFFGISPVEALAADYDSDGDDDLLLGDSSAPTLLLFRNNEGTLAQEASVALGFGRGHLAAADLDGDATLDLATTTLGGSSVTISFNDGTALFSETSSGITDGPSGLVIADANGDGLGDVFTSDGGDLFGENPGSTVSLFLQADDGSINSFARFAVDAGPSSITSADFNQDGTPDIAVCSLPTSSITLLLSGQ